MIDVQIKSFKNVSKKEAYILLDMFHKQMKKRKIKSEIHMDMGEYSLAI